MKTYRQQADERAVKMFQTFPNALRCSVCVDREYVYSRGPGNVPLLVRAVELYSNDRERFGNE